MCASNKERFPLLSNNGTTGAHTIGLLLLDWETRATEKSDRWEFRRFEQSGQLKGPHPASGEHSSKHAVAISESDRRGGPKLGQPPILVQLKVKFWEAAFSWP